MSKPVVVIRTVSVEKMSPVLNACRSKWPRSPIWVVSNSARCGEMLNDARVSRVLVGGEGGFRRRLDMDVDASAVVVPVANEFGSGYGNVFGASLGVTAQGYAICSRCQVIVEFGKWGFRLRWLSEKLVHLLALTVSGYLAERVLGRDESID